MPTQPLQTQIELAAAYARGAEMSRELLEESGGGWSTALVAQHLGVTAGEADHRRSAGTLLAVEVDGEYLFPACQFTEDGVVHGLSDALNAFGVESPWMRLAVLHSMAPMLPDTRVIDALRSGRIDEAMHAISTYGEHGAL